MVLDRDEWEKLKLALVALSNTGGIYDHTPFPIVVSYANDDMGTVIDTLRDCKISKFDGGGGARRRQCLAHYLRVHNPFAYSLGRNSREKG